MAQGVFAPGFSNLSRAARLDVIASHNMMLVMRYPEGHREAVRDRIVVSSAAALRRSGLSGIGIPALMKAAGLTHGAFYAHFDSREALVAEAVVAAGAATAKGLFADGVPLEETLQRYLSAGHLEHPEQGCVVAALGTDGSRQAGAVRSAFAKVARGLLRLVERKLHPEKPARTVSDDALRLASAMVGAVVLGRLVDDPALAERILRATRESVAARATGRRARHEHPKSAEPCPDREARS